MKSSPLSSNQNSSFLSKICISCQKTLSNPANAITLGCVAAGAIASSSFRLGLTSSPIGIASSLSITIFAQSAIGRRFFSKFSNLSSSLRDLGDKISNILPSIFPERSPTTSIVMPIIEEAIFRGAIQTLSVATLGTLPGIAFSALAFSAAHIDSRQPHQAINSLVGGIVLGALKEKFSILTSIGHHVGVNTFWNVIFGAQQDSGFVRNFIDLYGPPPVASLIRDEK